MTEEQAKTATLDELRDWLAGEDGWNYTFRHRHASGASQFCWITKGGRETFDHPHPPTLDGANAAVPCGWRWARYPRASDTKWWWVGIHADTGRHIDVPDTGDPVHDLYALALACVRAEEKAVAK